MIATLGWDTSAARPRPLAQNAAASPAVAPSEVDVPNETCDGYTLYAYGPNYQAIGTRSVLWIGLGLYYCVLAAAVYALVVLRRRGRRLLILIAAPIVVAISSLVGVGLDRLRYEAEIPLIALAAWAFVFLLARRDVASRR